MSNSLAIAAVTATVRNLLGQANTPLPFDPDPDGDLDDTICTTKPPDRARQNEDHNQLNLFLYQTAINAALRNSDAQPPLPLNLYYLVTAYGRNYDDLLGHRVLGRAMSILHDRPLLMPADIEAALPGSNLAHAVERVRITPHVLGGEELSKLWAIFQAPYRVTTAYLASVIVIDTVKRGRAGLPVLTRNVAVRPTTLPPFPALDQITLPRVAQPSARLGYTAISGDTITLRGHDLDGDSAIISFSHRLLPDPVTVTVTNPPANAIEVPLPAVQDTWPAGTYTVTARIKRATPFKDATSNGIALAIAPRIVDGLPGTHAPGDVEVALTVSPQVWPTQNVSLLVGDREIPAPPHSTQTDELSFEVPDLAKGLYLIRLRVDSVDSHVIAYSVTDPPTTFDPTQELTIA